MFDIDDIPVTDDLDVSNDPTTYQDPIAPPPPDEGAYQFRILLPKGQQDILQRNRQTGEIVLREGKYPVLNISGVQLVNEGFNERKVYPFQSISTKPYTRRDEKGHEVMVNNLSDLVRSHDTSLAFRGTKEGLVLVNQLVNDNAVFAAKFTWFAEDWRWRAEQLDALKANAEAANLEPTREAKGKIYEMAKLEGQAKFRNPETGRYETTWTGPSGNEIPVKFQIKSRGFYGFDFIPQLQQTRTRWVTRQAA